MKQLVFIIIALVLASVACGLSSGSDASESTIPPIITTSTRQVLVVTSTPTATVEASATPQPTATQFRNTSNSNSNNNTTTKPCYDATFVADITLPDGSLLAEGHTYVKTWRIRNTGTCSWGSGFQFEHVNRAGNAFSINDVGYVNLPAAGSGDVIDVSVNLTAKTGFASSQEHQANFRFRTSNGTYFGDTPFVKAYIVGEANIVQFTVGQTSIDAASLRNGTARIPVSWEVVNRPHNSNLVFEQIMPNETVKNIELPRVNQIIQSSGSGIVAPMLNAETSPEIIRLRLRLVDLATNSTIKQSEVTLVVLYENGGGSNDGGGTDGSEQNPDGTQNDGSESGAPDSLAQSQALQ